MSRKRKKIYIYTRLNNYILLFYSCNQDISATGVLIDQFAPEGMQSVVKEI